ncbi:gag-pol polyprotein [Tanacetum coccineum]
MMGSLKDIRLDLWLKVTLKSLGMDYEETFAPVAKITIVRTLIAVDSSCQWKISQMEVKNAFLNSDLKEEVYMKPPLAIPHQSGEVCKLRKALYGLKQAPRACVRLVRNLNGTLSIAFIIRNVKITLRLEEFARILHVPCRGVYVFTSEWAISSLPNGVDSNPDIYPPPLRIPC